MGFSILIGSKFPIIILAFVKKLRNIFEFASNNQKKRFILYRAFSCIHIRGFTGGKPMLSYAPTWRHTDVTAGIFLSLTHACLSRLFCLQRSVVTSLWKSSIILIDNTESLFFKRYTGYWMSAIFIKMTQMKQVRNIGWYQKAHRAMLFTKFKYNRISIKALNMFAKSNNLIGNSVSFLPK